MSIQTVEIALPTGIDSVSVGLAEPISIVEVRQGPAGEAGPAVINAATTSDGTAALYLDSIRFESTNGGPTQLGEMAWESNDGSIDAMLESGVIVAMGEDLVIRVRNTTASPITKGTALAYDGTSGASGRIEVKPWVGANIPTAKLFLGFAACDMPANSNGYSQWFGKLTEIDTSGGGQTWLDEQIIYAVPGVSATLTNVAPTSGEYAAAAVVINAGSGTSGILFVRPTFEVASSTSATANTLVLRDANGGASFAGIALSGINTNSGSYAQVGGENFIVATTSNANLTATGSGTVTVSGAGGTTISGGTLTFSPSAPIEQRNGNAAQESRIYGTYTGPGNYRRLALKMDTAGVAQIVAEGGGSGAVGNRIEIDGLRIGKGGGDVATNTALGASALNANTTGSNNSAVGRFALQDNTTGAGNSAFGSNALANNTTGTSNSAVGTQALANNTTANFNAAFGLQALISNTTGGSNAAVGNASLAGNTTGSSNSAVGSGAGRYIADGTTANTITANSVYLGANTKALASNQTNQIVIGYDATGIGSNTAVLGNDSIVTTALKGNVGIGTTSPASKLTVTGGDIEVTDSASGIILKSPNGTRYRITVDNAGALTTTAAI
jgi:hypothetical protein